MTSGVIFGDTMTRSVQIDTDLSDKECFLVNFDGSDDFVVNIASGATEFPWVLTEGGDGSTDELTGSIAVGGRVKIKLGGTVAAGDKITSDGSGKGITTTTDTNHYGLIALQAGVLNDLIEAIVFPGMVAG